MEASKYSQTQTQTVLLLIQMKQKCHVVVAVAETCLPSLKVSLLHTHVAPDLILEY